MIRKISEHGNAQPRVAKQVRLGCPILSAIFSIYNAIRYGSRSITYGLFEQRFHSFQDIATMLDSWKVSKDKAFFRREICLLPERLQLGNTLNNMYFSICFNITVFNFTIKIQVSMRVLIYTSALVLQLLDMYINRYIIYNSKIKRFDCSTYKDWFYTYQYQFRKIILSLRNDSY